MRPRALLAMICAIGSIIFLLTASFVFSQTRFKVHLPGMLMPGSAGILLTVQSDNEQAGPPGQDVTYALRVQNTSSNRATIQIRVNQSCHEHVTDCAEAVSQTSVTLNSGAATDIRLLVSLPPDATPGTRAPTRVEAFVAPDMRDEVTIWTTITPPTSPPTSIAPPPSPTASSTPTSTPTSTPPGDPWFVDPETGNDANPGDTPDRPFRTIQHALDVAQPGSTITLAPGRYAEYLHTVRHGRDGAPITIIGPRAAIVSGEPDGTERVFEITHSYITLTGFTIDGDTPTSDQYQDKLIFVQGQEAVTPLVGLRITNMALTNAGGECVRLRYYVQGAEIAHNTIGPCGWDDFPNGVYAGRGKNGEAIYVGTAPEQQDDGKNPEDGPDHSWYNHIHHNTIDTQGNECVEFKEHANFNLAEHNICTGQRDGEAAGLASRGSSNTFRFNTVTGSIGAGIRFGGDADDQGIENAAYGNIIRDNAYGAIKVIRDPQGRICGNDVAGNGPAYGDFYYDPAAPCPAED